MSSPKLLFAINELRTGGAQKTLLRVLKELNSEFQVFIIVFDKLGPVGIELLKSGYRIEVINVESVFDKVTLFYRLIKCMNLYKPTHVVTFLYFSDFIVGSIAKLIFRRIKVVWNIRNDVLKLNQTGLATWVISRINIFLSYLIPDKIIFVSQSSYDNHAALGYRKNISKVILNNVDMTKYIYSEFLRNYFRSKLQIEENTIVFGFAARYDKIKNINLFLNSIERYYARYNHTDVFIVCGEGMSCDNIELMELIRKYNLVDKILLLGYLENMVEFYSGIDCIVSTSSSEGSPNNILEAIATGLYYIVPGTFDFQNCPNGKIVVDMRPDTYSAFFNSFSIGFKQKTIKRHNREFDYPIENKHNLSIYFNSYFND